MELLSYVRTQWDRVGAWVAIALGAVALLVGWIGVSGTSFVFEQLPFVVSGGIGGLFLLGLGASLLLSADLRDEWRKLDAIEQQLAGGATLDRAAPAVHAETADVTDTVDASNGRRASSVGGAA